MVGSLRLTATPTLVVTEIVIFSCVSTNGRRMAANNFRRDHGCAY